MLNWRVLRGWPNWVIVPLILLFWVVFAVEMAQLLGAPPFHAEKKS